MLHFEFEGHLEAEFPLLQGTWQFYLLRPSFGLMIPFHMVVDNLLYSKSTDLNVNLI